MKEFKERGWRAIGAMKELKEHGLSGIGAIKELEEFFFAAWNIDGVQLVR